MLIISISIIVFSIIHYFISKTVSFETIFGFDTDNIFDNLFSKLCNVFIGWIFKFVNYFIAFVLTYVFMNLGLGLFKVELNVEHIGKTNINNEQVQNVDNTLTSNLKNITLELNNLIVEFKNNSKKQNDKNFTDFYKKLQQKSIDIRTYTINDITYFYEKEQLLQELEKESIKFSDNKQTKEIILTNYPIFKFGYYEFARGFEVNYEYLISQVKPYLSEQWISYLLLMKEQNLDTHKLQPNADEIDSSFCMKWKNKLETFLTTYPDFYLKDDIKKEIESYKEALKSIGLE